MAKNHVQEGNIMTWTNGTGSAVASGAVVVVGTLVGIALGDIANGATGELALAEVWEVAKDTSVAIAQGATVYWNGTGATSSAHGNVPMGHAFAAALQAATTLPVRLDSSRYPSPVIADPGNAGAIPVVASGNVAITTTAAQTRTLANPAAAGIELAISMAVDGGDAVITSAAAINQTGNNTITMNDAGDTIVLKSVKVASAYRWRVMVNDGCTLSTV